MLPILQLRDAHSKLTVGGAGFQPVLGPDALTIDDDADGDKSKHDDGRDGNGGLDGLSRVTFRAGVSTRVVVIVAVVAACRC